MRSSIIGKHVLPAPLGTIGVARPSLPGHRRLGCEAELLATVFDFEPLGLFDSRLIRR